jgi:hypothetical protein
VRRYLQHKYGNRQTMNAIVSKLRCYYCILLIQKLVEILYCYTLTGCLKTTSEQELLVWLKWHGLERRTGKMLSVSRKQYSVASSHVAKCKITSIHLTILPHIFWHPLLLKWKEARRMSGGTVATCEHESKAALLYVSSSPYSTWKDCLRLDINHWDGGHGCFL